jgi:hypothetical protein
MPDLSATDVDPTLSHADSVVIDRVSFRRQAASFWQVKINEKEPKARFEGTIKNSLLN